MFNELITKLSGQYGETLNIKDVHVALKFTIIPSGAGRDATTTRAKESMLNQKQF